MVFFLWGLSWLFRYEISLKAQENYAVFSPSSKLAFPPIRKSVTLSTASAFFFWFFQENSSLSLLLPSKVTLKAQVFSRIPKTWPSHLSLKAHFALLLCTSHLLDCMNHFMCIQYYVVMPTSAIATADRQPKKEYHSYLYNIVLRAGQCQR